MEFTDQEKVEEVKRILIARLEGVGSLEALHTLVGDTAWAKLIQFLGTDLQSEADQCATDSQNSLNRKKKLLALLDEKDTL